MNLLDSSGWIEYFANGPNAGQFAPVATATAALQAWATDRLVVRRQE